MNDYYELLQIAPKASKLDIINAYRHAKLTFSKGSLAAYSLYNEEELDTIWQQIDTAYAVLSDRDKRCAYDELHGYTSAETDTADPMADIEDMASSEFVSDALPASSSAVDSSDGSNVVRLHRRKKKPNDTNLEQRLRTAKDFPGALLREVRECRGLALRDVAMHTRISLAYLEAIEAEDASAFPARVYLRGYLGQYAAEIGLEPHRVVQGYPPLSWD